MNVLFVNALYTPNLFGGAERVVQSLAENAVKAGHQAVVVTAVPRKDARVDVVNGVKVYYLGLKNLYWPWRDEGKPEALKPLWHAIDAWNPLMARDLGRVLDTERPDVVHTHLLVGFSTLVWQAVKQRGLPLVHTMHDYYLLCPRASMFRNGKNCSGQCADCRPYASPKRRSSNKVDVVVGVSQFVLERHLRFGHFAATPERRVIYNAYETVTATPPPRRPSLPIWFGFLGRLDDTKGIDALLASTARLPAGSWSLEVAGQGTAEYERRLRANYGASTIRFSGHVRPEDLFSRIDALVVPSVYHDISPRVFSEAYAHGVPVIGSRRGGIPELVEEGRTGFLFDPDHPGDLTVQMQRYTTEPALAGRMRDACLQKARTLLPGNITGQHIKVYAGALGWDQ